VVVAYDGQEGFAAILKTMPDLVLSDICMPAMSGFEALEKLTALAPRFGNLPFLFLTAMTDRDNELKGRHLGADDYVTKPIDFDVLVAIITARLAQVARSECLAQSCRSQRPRGRDADLGGTRQDIGGDRGDSRLE
jgi:DNA-binding response OmpR family regulator